jgi:PPOX class probable F420-dependent enzyme
MRAAVADARVARLATVRPDGRPHVVPVCFALVDDVVYSAVDQKPKRSRDLVRLANVEATGVASLLVDGYAEDWSTLWWVRLDGPARIATDPAEADRAIAALTSKYPQYAARPPAGPVLALTVDDWTGWSASPVDSGPPGDRSRSRRGRGTTRP